MIVVFTEYVLPDGRKRPKNIRVTSDLEIQSQYKKILNKGYYFDYEILTTGIESITCENSEESIGHELVLPPRTIQAAVVDLIQKSYGFLLNHENQEDLKDITITP
jgi:hypothetical protein